MSDTSPTSVDVTTLESSGVPVELINDISVKIENLLIAEKANTQAAVCAFLALAIVNIRPGQFGADTLGQAIYDVSQFISMLPDPGTVDAEVVSKGDA